MRGRREAGNPREQRTAVGRQRTDDRGQGFNGKFQNLRFQREAGEEKRKVESGKQKFKKVRLRAEKSRFRYRVTSVFEKGG